MERKKEQLRPSQGTRVELPMSEKMYVEGCECLQHTFGTRRDGRKKSSYDGSGAGKSQHHEANVADSM